MRRPNSRLLVDQLYEAALDDTLWPAWASQMAAEFGGQGALFCIIDTERHDMCRSYFLWPDVDAEAAGAEYLSDRVDSDPQMHRVCSSPESEIYRDLEHLDLSDPTTREYVGWQEDLFGTRHHMTATVKLGSSLLAAIALHRSRAEGPFTTESVAQMRRIFPHYRRAIQLGRRHVELLQTEWWESEEKQADKASILFDERGAVLRLTQRARSILAQRDGLDFADGHIMARESGINSQLQALLRRALLPTGAEAGALAVPRPSGKRALQLFVYPLVRARRFLAPLEGAALIHIVEAIDVKPLDDPHRALFGLSAREAQVASLLLQGHSIESLAVSLGISANTAKVHLASIFRKTGTNRQTELIRLLISTS